MLSPIIFGKNSVKWTHLLLNYTERYFHDIFSLSLNFFSWIQLRSLVKLCFHEIFVKKMLERISISCCAHFWYGWLCKKQISMTVILSQPSPPIEESEARHLVMSSSQISSGSNPCANRWMTKSATSWLLNTSQIPSHARTTNWRSSVISRTTTSGSGEMICFSAASSGLVLKAKSPKARLRAKFPLTRLNSTNPPACKKRLFLL